MAYALRHEGVWLTVNTPKDLRVASEYLAEHPGGRQARVRDCTV
jgi:NDP-sugar pyrophosphorylase family protein